MRQIAAVNHLPITLAETAGVYNVQINETGKGSNNA
jgi:hypothetical protein